MNTSSLRLTALTVLLAAVGFAVSLTGCASTGGIEPAGDSTLDDVLSRDLAANPGQVVMVPNDRREIDLRGGRLVASAG